MWSSRAHGFLYLWWMMGTITALEVQKRNKERVNVYLDDAYAFSLSLDEAARLRKGQALSDADIAALQNDDSLKRAVDSASRYLAHRPRSIAEVRQNLADKEFPEPIIEAALERLITLGYLDDHAFASFWVGERNRFKPLGTRALRYELRQKGISEAIISDVLAELDVDDAAYRAALPQLRRLRGSSRRVFEQKIGGFLQRRGFSYDVARQVLRQLQEELDASDPAYFTGDSFDDNT